MGVCCCKRQEPRLFHNSSFDDIRSGRDRQRKRRDGEATTDVDLLVLEALSALRSLADNDEAPPECMNILHSIAEEEDGWLSVVKSCIFSMPLEDTLGSAVVCLLLDECPLPTRDSIRTLTNRLNLSKQLGFLAFETNKDSRVTPMNPAICRNILVVLACLAEKLAGPLSTSLLTEGTLEFLLDKLDPQEHPAVVLHAILTLEKLAHTSENKLTISAAGIAERLQLIETAFLPSSAILEHEAGFCAQWALDNTFPYPGRPLSYENVDLSTINCMLNNNDVSEYLKISPTGLEARCDAASFESVRCTCRVSSGVWYYEVTLLTAGVMQIGWATKDSKFLNHEGYGIGDDEFSCAYDGCRRLIWHAARSSPNHQKAWTPGDVLGVLLDMDRGCVGFSLNNCSMEVNFPAARSGAGFFPAASFMSYQHCIFNFGSEPFKYPPSLPFSNFNDHAQMHPEDKVVLPRYLKLAAIRQESVTEDPCKICFQEKANTRLEPCQHGELCMTCALQMQDCPLCRNPIAERVFEDPHSPS